jgi:hypothetical protein
LLTLYQKIPWCTDSVIVKSNSLNKMPVDDLVAWAADTNQDGPPKAKKVVSPLPAHETLRFRDSPSPVRRPQSPSPKRNRLPRWFDIGHCPAACSGRCVLHAAQQEDREDTSLPEDTESFQTRQRSHRRHKNGSQDLLLSSTSKPKGLEAKYRNSRLDLAEEMERLKI